MSIPRPTIISAVLALTVVSGLAACGGDDSETVTNGADETAPASAQNADLPQGSEHVDLDPADFTTDVDNPYWPMAPGSRWVYREIDTEGTEEKVVVEVTDKTRTIANGIEARVVRDTVTEDGVPVEVTDDWYAQDAEGNIWYLGEATQEFVNGKPGTTEGSFEAGVGGAEPGIAMPADPQPGMEYRQEYLEGEAEDTGAVITVGEEQVEVPYGFFGRGQNLVMTRDLNPLERRVQEFKFFAPGVGMVLAVHLDGAGGREELVSYDPAK